MMPYLLSSELFLVGNKIGIHAGLTMMKMQVEVFT
jgi:hypothetical protein